MPPTIDFEMFTLGLGEQRHLTKTSCQGHANGGTFDFQGFIDWMQFGYLGLHNGLVQTVKSLYGLSGKICPREFPREIRLSRGAQPRQTFWWPERIPVGKFFR